MRTKIAVMVLVLISIFALAQSATKPKVQIVPAPYTPADSGKAMYDAYCASCHGESGKGNGPAAEAMKAAVPDLTVLTKTHNGTYPAFQVAEVLRLTRTLSAHGSAEMPVWGPIFSKMSQQNNAEIQQRIHNLNEYLASLQEK